VTAEGGPPWDTGIATARHPNALCRVRRASFFGEGSLGSFAHPSRHYVGGHALVLRPSSQVSPPVAVTVTTTPSGSGGIELERMEHAVDPSRCATNVPQGHHSGAVPEVSEAGPKSLTCTNTPGRRRARTDDLRIENEQTARPLAMWHKMCHLLVIKDGFGSSEAVCRPLTCTNTGGPRRARTDDLRIKRTGDTRSECWRSADSCVVR
jgi:hypothetical protein